MKNKNAKAWWVALVALSACEQPADVASWGPPSEDPQGSPALEGDAPASVPPGQAGLSPPSVQVFISDEWSDQTPPPDSRSFSVIDTGDLFFYAYFANLEPGVHVARIELYGPDGYLYRTLSMPFTIATDLGTVKTGVGSAEPTAMGSRVVLDLPVAGTNISQYSLTGTWQARLLLDVVAGQPEAEATFEFYSSAD